MLNLFLLIPWDIGLNEKLVWFYTQCAGFHSHKRRSDTYASEYDTHECDNDTQECDLYTQSVIYHTNCEYATHECD
jgi:hypothetical protein